VEAGFNSDIGGDVPDWDSTESRESDEDAAWRDLVARFDAPATTAEPAPWPERENVPPTPTRDSRGANPVGETAGSQDTRGPEGERGTNGARGAEDAHDPDGPAGDRGAHAAEDVPGVDGAGGTRIRPGSEDGPDGAEDPLGRGTGDTRGRGDGDSLGRSGKDASGRAGKDASGRAGKDASGRAGRDSLGRGDGDSLGRGDGDSRGRGEEGPLGRSGRDSLEPGAGGASRGTAGVRGFDDEGVRGALDPDGLQGAHEPDVIQAARRRRRTAERRIRARQAPVRDPQGDDEDEHFIPPAPPPLPTLDPVAKGAWAALFGGPGYLVVATALGWSVPGFAAFCAVAAFVTGFAILVLRLNDPGPGGPDDGDDGAVV
jgi:hypothetical protein